MNQVFPVVWDDAPAGEEIDRAITAALGAEAEDLRVGGADYDGRWMGDMGLWAPSRWYPDAVELASMLMKRGWHVQFGGRGPVRMCEIWRGEREEGLAPIIGHHQRLEGAIAAAAALALGVDPRALPKESGRGR
jgi:hypothetical protein